VIQRQAFVFIAVLGSVLPAGCGILEDQIIGVWTQPGEHFGGGGAGSHCRSYQGYDVIWDVQYPENLRLANFSQFVEL